jgi:hypothetical protein
LKVEDKIHNEIKLLLDRPDVSDGDKKSAFDLMSGVQNGRMRTVDYFSVAKILADNRANKKERAKRNIATKIFENATSMACQACHNLDDMKIPVLPKEDRLNLVARISEAAVTILRIQNELLHDEEQDDRGGNPRSLRGGQKSISDLAPVAAPVPGEPREEDC